MKYFMFSGGIFAATLQLRCIALRTPGAGSPFCK